MSAITFVVGGRSSLGEVDKNMISDVAVSRGHRIPSWCETFVFGEVALQFANSCCKIFLFILMLMLMIESSTFLFLKITKEMNNQTNILKNETL